MSELYRDFWMQSGSGNFQQVQGGFLDTPLRRAVGVRWAKHPSWMPGPSCWHPPAYLSASVLPSSHLRVKLVGSLPSPLTLSLSLPENPKGQKPLLSVFLRGGDEVKAGPAWPALGSRQSTWDFKQLISPICKTISF